MDIDTYVIEPLAGGIADLLVREGLLTSGQVAYALRVKSKMAAGRSLLDLLGELGYVSRDAIMQASRKSIGQLSLGPLLTDLGLLSPQQLDTANLMAQSMPGKPMVALLAEEGLASEQAIAEALASLLGFKLADLAFREIDRTLTALMTPDSCRSHACIPVMREGDQIQVAFADPLDAGSRGAVINSLGRKVTPLIAPYSSIMASLDRLGHSSESAVTGEAALLVTIITAAQEAGARVIHVEPLPDRLRVRFRRDGALILYKDLPVEAKQRLIPHIRALVSESSDNSSSGSFSIILADGIPQELLVSCSVTSQGERLVLSLVNRFESVPEIAALGMSPRNLDRFIYDALESPTGIMLIVGPAGSGKTTTLYSSIAHLNSNSTNIMTIEGQVECQLVGVAQCVAGQGNGESLEELLCSVTAQDPDVIAIGLSPSEEVVSQLVRVALTGRKLLLTRLGEDTLSALSLLLADREPFLITASINSLLAQHLLRKVCPDCAKQYIPSPQELTRIGLSQEFLQGSRFMAGQGCKACQFTGYRGRLAVFELLTLNEPIREAILARKGSAEILRVSRETAGFVSLFEDGLVKAARGLVHVRDLIRTLPKTGKPRPVNELKRILGEHQ